MLKQALILVLLIGQPAFCQSSKQTPAEKFKLLNDAGIHLIGKDNSGAQILLEQAYQSAVLEKNPDHMKIAMDNLASVHQMQYLQRPQFMVMPQPSFSMSDLMDKQTFNQMQLMDFQNGFDRQTMREDHSFEEMRQRQAIEARDRDRRENLERQREQAQLDEVNARNTAAYGTSYWSNYGK